MRFADASALECLATSTDGYSGDDLDKLAREALMCAFRDFKESRPAAETGSGTVAASTPLLTKRHLDAALSLVLPTVDADQTALFHDFTRRYGLNA